MRVYRASALGYSLEALVAPHLGYEPVNPPEWIQAKFNEGHRIEPLAIGKLQKLGWGIQTDQEDINSVGDNQIEVELEIIPGKAKVVGHLDGITYKVVGLTSRPSIVEIKRIYAKGWEQFKARGWDTPGLIQKYKWQASAYMLATGLPHVMVAWNADTEELAYAVTLEPFYTISDIANKLQACEDAIDAGVLPDGCTDYPCAYFYLHENKENVPTESADNELEAVMAAWLEADKAEKVYKKEKDSLREQIIALVGTDESVAKVKGACGVTVSTKWVEEQNVSFTKKAHWETRVQGPRK